MFLGLDYSNVIYFVLKRHSMQFCQQHKTKTDVSQICQKGLREARIWSCIANKLSLIFLSELNAENHQITLT